MNRHVLEDEVSRMSLDEQALLAQSMSTQALLSALYDKSLQPDRVRRDFTKGRYSLLSVFDERGRLRVLIENFGEMMLAITDTQYDKGERSNGWQDISRSAMRDIVIQNLMRSLSKAMESRLRTKSFEDEES